MLIIIKEYWTFSCANSSKLSKINKQIKKKLCCCSLVLSCSLSFCACKMLIKRRRKKTVKLCTVYVRQQINYVNLHKILIQWIRTIFNWPFLVHIDLFNILSLFGEFSTILRFSSFFAWEFVYRLIC